MTRSVCEYVCVCVCVYSKMSMKIEVYTLQITLFDVAL